MRNKAVDNYHNVLKLVLDCYITQKLCDKAVNTYHSTMEYFLDCYKTQEMCEKAVNKYLSCIYLHFLSI